MDRRGFMGWLGALLGGAAAAKVAPAEAPLGHLGTVVITYPAGAPAPLLLKLNPYPYALAPEYQALREANSGINSVARGAVAAPDCTLSVSIEPTLLAYSAPTVRMSREELAKLYPRNRR